MYKETKDEEKNVNCKHFVVSRAESCIEAEVRCGCDKEQLQSRY